MILTQIALESAGGVIWQVGVTDAGVLTTTRHQGNPVLVWLQSSNGTIYLLDVDDDGTLSTTQQPDGIPSTVHLQSPDQSWFQLDVSDAGALSTSLQTITTGNGVYVCPGRKHVYVNDPRFPIPCAGARR